MYTKLVVLLALILLVGCAAPAGAPREVPVTVPVEVTRLVEVTRQVEVTVPVEVTRVVEIVVTPTLEPTLPPAATIVRLELAEPVTQEIGGVKLTVQQCVLTAWADASQWPEAQQWAADANFAGAQAVGVITLALENGTGSSINVHGNQGTVVVGTEQVELSQFMFYGEGDVGGEFRKDVRSEGTVVFPLQRTAWADIAAGVSVLYEVAAPTDNEYRSLGDAPFVFELSLVPTEVAREVRPSPTPRPTSQPTSGVVSDVIAAFNAAGLAAESVRPLTKDDYGMAPYVGNGVRFLIPALGEDAGGRLFVVEDPEERATLKTFYEELSKASALFFSWVFEAGPVVMQINGDLPEEQARQYEAALKAAVQ